VRNIRFTFVWLAVLVAVCLPRVHADTVESVIMPGKVIEGHAKIETDCQQCHARFKKGAQSGLCLDCHKDIAKDAIQKQGYHGRLIEKECRECHTDHKGRDMNIAPLDEKKFDHKLTDFVLKGGHAAAKVQCRDCHVKGKKYREAPSNCVACHRKDDKHKGKLGDACADCHTDKNWKDTRFDHSKTKFPLTGKHVDVACKDCHSDPAFKGAPTKCVACHKKDDDKKGHKGRFGEKCETCHNDRDWKSIHFDHDRSTKYPLKGKHRMAKCTACHTGILYKEKFVTTCVACHRADDDKKGHKGKFGDKCETCHVEKDWTAIIFDHDKQTKYPLRGKHITTKCTACHKGDLYKDKLKTTCFSCHEKDDKHKGQEGPKCESCHNERDWKTAPFDHGLTRFPLLGKHVKVECKKCHLTPAFKDASVACNACHKQDDERKGHKRRLGTECGDCHNARNWKEWNFDHDTRTHFKLDGGHKGIKCEACHVKPMTGKISLPGTCVSCHDDDDVHHGSFGHDCDRCHVTSKFNKIRPGVARGFRDAK
jgi:hypothetical protein